MTGKIIYIDRIGREFVKAHPEDRFVFGDNMQRAGFGGQALAMRGEPNSIGLRTKRQPNMNADAFFEDGDNMCLTAIRNDLEIIGRALDEGRTVYIPKDGFGTGLAQLPQRAPKLYNIIVQWFKQRSKDCPWTLEEVKEG